MLVRMIVLSAVILLVLSGSVLAQLSTPPPIPSAVAGVAAGGNYRLAVQTWQVRGATEGGNYQLAAPTSLMGTGTPCCCVFIPCVLRNKK